MARKTVNMEKDEITLPDGVEQDDVQMDDSTPEAVAYVEREDQWDEAYLKPFNPENGRWYDTRALPNFDSLRVGGELTVDCAYEDCRGEGGEEVSASIDCHCPDCGAPAMGRKQFSKESINEKRRRGRLNNRISNLSDDFAVEMSRLKDAGVGTVPAMDYLMCSVGEVSLVEWAESRGVSEDTVKWNMKQVANALGETVRYKK